MKRLLILFLISCAVFACTYRKAETKPDCEMPGTVSFATDIIPVFNNHCNTSGCHSGSNPTGGLNLEPSVAYAELMSSGSGYIDTITPGYSLLYASMISVSDPMPPSGKLDKCTTDLVYKWIQQKAKNN